MQEIWKKQREIEEQLLRKHPNWPQEKARWLAMAALNLIEIRSKR